MKKTNKEVEQFINTAHSWLGRNKDAKESKFTYALRKVLTRAQKSRETYYEGLQDINIECALEDEKTKALLQNDRGEFQFSREGLLERNKKIRTLANAEASIDHHYVAELPKGLTEEEIETFTGFVISPKPTVVEQAATA